jgi:antitoxin ParD1/3/4
MPTSVALGAHFEEFIKAQLASGRYNNVSEVVREGLRLLEDQEALRQMKLQRLRADIQAGLDSGPATPLNIEEVKTEGRRLLAAKRANAGGQQA